MNLTIGKKWFLWMLVVSFLLPFAGTTFAGGSISVQWGKADESRPPEQPGYQKTSGPPAHAPAYGYRAKHKYRYYPCSNVYHDADRGLYFYLEGSNWRIGASLPSNLQMGLGESVSLELDTDKPYIYNAEHVKKYPPGQQKKGKGSKWSKK
jgi:hypothetical protein